MHSVLCFNTSKKSMHVMVYKQARIWPIKPEASNNKNIPVTATRSTTINYATENAVLLCSMNIAKNHWVTFKCAVIHISLHWSTGWKITDSVNSQFVPIE